MSLGKAFFIAAARGGVPGEHPRSADGGGRDRVQAWKQPSLSLWSVHVSISRHATNCSLSGLRPKVLMRVESSGEVPGTKLPPGSHAHGSGGAALAVRFGIY